MRSTLNPSRITERSFLGTNRFNVHFHWIQSTLRYTQEWKRLTKGIMGWITFIQNRPASDRSFLKAVYQGGGG